MKNTLRILVILTLQYESICLAQQVNSGTLTLNSVQDVDLKGVDRVLFNLPSRETITTFSNVVPGQLYVFQFLNGNTTISRQHAYLANGNALNPDASSSLLFVGETSTLVRQVTDASLSNIREFRTLEVNSVQDIDLNGVDCVSFNLTSRETITTFSNVVPGQLYVFKFLNDNATISRQHAYLVNGNALNPDAGTSLLFVGETSTLVRQVTDAPLSNIRGIRTLEVNSVQDIDLNGVDRVVFNLSSRGMITTFSNIVPGKLYVFHFANGNTTVSRNHAYLAYGVDQRPATGSDIIIVGETPRLIRQVVGVNRVESAVSNYAVHVAVAIGILSLAAIISAKQIAARIFSMAVGHLSAIFRD